MEFLTKPYTEIELKEKQNKDGFIKDNVLVELDDMIERDYETFANTLTSYLVGMHKLTNLEYRPIGVHERYIIFEVSGKLV